MDNGTTRWPAGPGREAGATTRVAADLRARRPIPAGLMPEWDPGRSPDCLLVAEPTPLLLLALAGRHALDLLLVPGAEVRIAESAAAGLPPGWLAERAGRVGLQRARRGAEPGLDARSVISAVSDAGAGGRGVIALVDDGPAHAAVALRDMPRVRLLTTRGFLGWVATAFGVAAAASAGAELSGVCGSGRA